MSDKAIYTALRNVEQNSNAGSKALAFYLFRAIEVHDEDFESCYYFLENSNDHHEYALPLTRHILKSAGCSRVFELDKFVDQSLTLPNLPKLELRELVAVIARNIAAKDSAKKFIGYVCRTQLKMNPDNFSFDLEGVLKLFEAAENDCVIFSTEVTPMIDWLEFISRRDLVLKVQNYAGEHPISDRVRTLSNSGNVTTPVGTPPQGQGESKGRPQTEEGFQTSKDVDECPLSPGPSNITTGFQQLTKPATTVTPVQVPTSSSPPLQGSNMPPQHSHYPPASGYPPDRHRLPPVAAAQAQPYHQGSNIQSQHSIGSIPPPASGYPPHSGTLPPGPGTTPGAHMYTPQSYHLVPTTLPPLHQGSNIHQQYSSHDYHHSRHPPTSGFSPGSSVRPPVVAPGPGVTSSTHMPHLPYPGPTTSPSLLQSSSVHSQYSHGDHQSLHSSASGYHTDSGIPPAGSGSPHMSHPQGPTTSPPLLQGSSVHSQYIHGDPQSLHPSASGYPPDSGIPPAGPGGPHMSHSQENPSLPSTGMSSQYSHGTDGRYSQMSGPLSSMGSGGSTTSSSVSSISSESSYGRSQSYSSTSSVPHSQEGSGSPLSSTRTTRPIGVSVPHVHTTVPAHGSPDLQSQLTQENYHHLPSRYSQEQSFSRVQSGEAHTSATGCRQHSHPQQPHPVMSTASLTDSPSAGPPANLTYGPPSTPSQFTPQNSMRWSGDPIQQQNPLLSPSQVIAGTPATNLPSPATGSHQGHSPILPATSLQHSTGSSHAYPHYRDEGGNSNSVSTGTGPGVGVLTTQQTCTYRQEVEQEDASSRDPSLRSMKQISVEEQKKDANSPWVYSRLRGLSLEEGCVQNLKPILCKSYENMGTPHTERLRIKSPCESFANPVFSYAKENGEVFLTDRSITYDSLFPTEVPEGGKRTVIQSDPGCGKTLLLTKAAKDWAAGKCLKNISLLLYIPLAGKQCVSLDDLLSLYYPDEKMREKAVRYVTSCNGSGVCFCFDGLQKNPPSTIAKILNGAQLHEALVFTACQPEAIEFVQAQGTRIVRIESFHSEQVEAYIHNCLDAEHARVLIEYIDSYPLLQQLCSVPLHLAIIIHLFNCSGSTSLPDTDTKILEVLVLNLLWLYLSSQSSSGSGAIELASFNQLPQQEQLAFDCLCSLAYNQILESKNTFSRQDVQTWTQDVQTWTQVSIEMVQSLCTSLILCSQHRSSSGLPMYLYRFFNPEIQAYFAALHLYRKLTYVQQEEAVARYAKQQHLRSLWKFYCGIACKDCPRTPPNDSFLRIFSTFVQHVIITSTTSTMALELIPLFRCAFETRLPEVCTCLLEKLRGSIAITRDEQLTRPNCSIIGYVIYQSHYATSTLDLSNSCLSSECIAALVNQLEKAHLEKISTLRLQGQGPVKEFETTTALLSFLGKLRQLQKLSLCNIHMKPSNQGDLLQTISQLQQLHTLSLSGNSLSPESGTELAKLLVKLKGLQELDLSYNPIGEQGLKGMSAGLVDCIQLTVLRLRECRLAEVSGSTLTNILKKLPRLSDLDLQGNRLQSMGVVNMLPGLMSPTCSLVNLNLKGNNMDDSGAVSLIAYLKRRHTLKTLRLSGNHISPEATTMLCQEAKNPLCNVRIFISEHMESQ